jgi:hypothetical protein
MLIKTHVNNIFMKNFIFLFISVTLFFIIGCTKRDSRTIGSSSSGGAIHKVNTVFYSAMTDRGQSPYLQYLDSTNCNMYFFVSNTLANASLGNIPQCSIQAGPAKTNVGQYNINNIEIPYNMGYQISNIKTIQSNSATLMKYFGSTVTFSCTNSGKTVVNQQIYIPPIINLNNIYGKPDQPIKVNGAANLSWNTDTKNANGVVIRIKVDDANTKTYVENIGLYPDNGSCTINSSLFAGIPSNLPFTVEVIRGNIVIATGSDNLTYKFYAYSTSLTIFML